MLRECRHDVRSGYEDGGNDATRHVYARRPSGTFPDHCRVQCRAWRARRDATFAQFLPMPLGIVAAIGIDGFRFLQGASAHASDRRNGIDQRQQLRDVIAVCASQDRRDGDAIGVRGDVVLGTWSRAIGGVRACFSPAPTARMDDESTTTREKSIWSAARNFASSSSCNLQDPASRAFSLSGRLLEFSHTILAYNRVREEANPHMERLSRRTGETVNLIELVGEDIVYVARFPSQHAVSVDIHIGSRLPAFCTAAGRAILSRYSESEIRARIGVKQRKAWTENTVTDTPSLLALISKARFDGYAVNDQETFIGDISLAAPLTDASGRPVAAINISAPVPRWTVEQAEKELVPHLLSTVAKINRELKAME